MDQLGQCGWIWWVEDGGDGSACPSPATTQVRVVPDGAPLPVTAVFCDAHLEAGTVRLRDQGASLVEEPTTANQHLGSWSGETDYQRGASMDPNDDTYLGRVAYEGYRERSRGVSLVSGQELPAWDDQAAEIQSAWCAAASAVQGALPEDPTELGFAPESEG